MKGLTAIYATAALLVLASAPAWAQHAAEDAHGSGGLPQFDPHWWPSQVFWLVVCFAVLYVALAKSIIPNIGGVLETRRARIQGDIAAAESLRAQAAQAEETYEKLMSDARAGSSRLLNDATAAVKAEAEKHAAAARDRAAREMEGLEARLETVKREAKQDMQGLVAEIASAAAEKIVGVKPDLKRANDVVQSLTGTEAA